MCGKSTPVRARFRNSIIPLGKCPRLSKWTSRCADARWVLSNGYGWIKSMDSLGCVVDGLTVARGGRVGKGQKGTGGVGSVVQVVSPIRSPRAFLSAKRFSWFSMPPSLPHSSRPFCSLFDLFVFSSPALFPRKFFPIIGKRPKNFSNHWKNRPVFSNHWKTFFQSLENPPSPRGPADCAPSIGVRGACKTGGRGAGICGAIPCPGCKADSPGRRPAPRTGHRRR